MMIATRWFALLAPLAATALLLPATSGCQDDDGKAGGGTGLTPTTTTTTTASGTTHVGGNGQGGSTSTGGSGLGGGTSTCGVGAVTATIQEITQGQIGPGIDVRVEGAVVMSQKFLVSKSSAGNCLWGAFVSAPGLATTAPNTGVLVVSYGFPAAIPPGGTTAYCPMLDEGVPQGDAIPENVQPGDIVTIIGRTDYFLLSQCQSEPNGSSVAQRQVSRACLMQVTGTATPPAPAVIADLASLASPSNTAFHDQWGGVKVRIENVTSSANPIVGDYGVIKLDGSNLEVGDKIYYRGYQKNELCTGAPVFDTSPATWTGIEGFSYLSYCTWGLQPNDKCSDFAPRSEDCGSTTTCAPY